MRKAAQPFSWAQRLLAGVALAATCCLFGFPPATEPPSAPMALGLASMTALERPAVVDRVRGALWGIHIADALSMPVHW